MTSERQRERHPRPAIIDDWALVKLAGWDEETIRRQRREWKQDLLTCDGMANLLAPDIAKFFADEDA